MVDSLVSMGDVERFLNDCLPFPTNRGNCGAIGGNN